VYWRGGALLSSITSPGFHLKAPMITTFKQVQVTVQTDLVQNIPCGTSGGVVIYFEKVEVVNRLDSRMVHDTVMNYTVDYDKTWIFDKIHHEINQFCSLHTLQDVYIDKFDTLDEALRDALRKDLQMWAPGIHIISIRVTKPRIPEAIRRNYELMEAEKTRLLIAEQNQKVVQKEAETEHKKATINANKVLEVSKITLMQQVAEKQSHQEMERIANEMHAAKEKSRADAEFYRAEKEAASNQVILTPEYLELQRIRAMGEQAKTFVYGERIPNIMMGNAAMPGAESHSK